jgi:nucleotide-binding universal stress UspA family protein
VWINGELRRILVGYDGSIESKMALEAAFALGQRTESQLFVFSVARPPEPKLSGRAHAGGTASEQLARSLAQLRRRVRRMAIEIETQVAREHPAEEIIRKAREDQMDLIVVGHQGMSRGEVSS